MNVYFPTNRVTLKRTERRENGNNRRRTSFRYSHLPTYISLAPTFKTREQQEKDEQRQIQRQKQQKRQKSPRKSKIQPTIPPSPPPTTTTPIPPTLTKPTLFLNDETYNDITTTNPSSTSFTKSHITTNESFRDKCGRFVNSSYIQTLIVILIILNSLTLGIATTSRVAKNQNLYDLFETIDVIFLVVFTAELVLQFVYRGFRLFLDGWLLFDFTIIVVSWTCQALQVVRGLRSIRALRVCRSVRLVARIRVMREIVVALLSVIPRMIAIGVLNSIVMYIFGVMFTILFSDLFRRGYLEYDYFRNLQDTIFTLFQIMTLDGWSDICRETMVAFKWAWLPFFAYVTLSAFIMINLVVAVVCDAIADLERARMERQDMNNSNHTMWSSVTGTASAASYNTDVASIMNGTQLTEKVSRVEEQVSLLARSQERTQDMADFLVKQIQSNRRRRRGGMNHMGFTG